MRVKALMGKKPKIDLHGLSIEAGILVSVLFACFLTFTRPYGINELGRLALARAIAYDRTLVINRYSAFVEKDASYYRGNLYSVAAPGVSFLATPFLLLGPILQPLLDVYKAASEALAIPGLATSGQILSISFFSIICTAVTSVYVFRTARFLGSTDKASVVPALTYILATPALVFGRFLWSHTFSSLFVMASVYYAFKARDSDSRTSMVASGIAAAIAMTLEYTNAALVIPIVAYLATKRRGRVMWVLRFLLPCLVAALLILAYNYVCFDNPFVFPEKYWLGYRYMGEEPEIWERFSLAQVPAGIYGLLFSPARGLFVYSPVLLFSVAGFFVLWKKKMKETLLLLSIFLANLLIYSAWWSWHGGCSYGPRFLIASLACFLCPMSKAVEDIDATTRRVSRRLVLLAFTALLVASVIVTSIGAVTTPNPYGIPEYFPFVDSPIVTCLQKIFSGEVRSIVYNAAILKAYGSTADRSTIPQVGIAYWLGVAAFMIIVCVASLRQLYMSYSSSEKPDILIEG